MAVTDQDLGSYINVKTREPRYRLLRVSYELVLTVILGQQSSQCLVKGLPTDVEICSVMIDQLQRFFVFTLWSKDWPPVPEGNEIPYVGVMVTAPTGLPEETADNPFYAR